ncbi:MAG: M1 family metallopeptidase [Bacteroidetes bacterium]|nr:M1 family metallopeptidase [Bacteroidota bacterium]MBK8486617.1 M1 family metallopeptidase [Bacteroidota bacterium]
MKFRSIAILILILPILTQCDPTKKLYKSEAYQGDIDTSYTDNYDYGDDYNYDDEYDYNYDDSDYASEGVDTISPFSSVVYRASHTRTNDLLHTKLEVSFDWAKAYLYGKATLTFKPYFYATSQLVLDAKGMDLNSIAMVNANGNTPLQFTYDSLQITIDLGREFKKEESYTILIEYTSKPNNLPEGGSFAITSDKGLYFINNDGSDPNKPMQIWTQGETEASSAWFPTIDKPNERTTDEIYITIEDKYKTLSNGVMVSSKKNADGTRTDYWKMDKPHAPYLFMMAIGEFAIVKDTWEGMPVDYYVEPEYAKYAKDIFGNTPEMLSFYSKVLNYKYPWPKYSQVIVRDYVSGAMENTSATLHGEFMQQTDRELLDENYEDVISHEVFHQWFGDLVTIESWSNIPLNEAFATYGEYLWREHKYGRDFADEHLQEDLYNYISESQSKMVDMIRFNYENKEDMFDSHSYAKGGAILHMLRKYVGDDAFFASLNNYLTDNAYNSVEIHNLRLAFEAVTGEDLNWFFNEWFFNAGHANLYYSHGYDEYTGKASLTVDQLQSDPAPIYTLPVDVDVYVNGKATRHRIIIDRPSQTFYFNVDAKPDFINFDAENMLVAEITGDLSDAELAMQYRMSPLYLDRYTALQQLAYQQYYNTDAIAVLTEALNDPAANIRVFALDTITINTETSQALKDKIVMMAKSDKKSIVRSSAIARLPELNLNNTEELIRSALNDSAYSVVGSALMQLFVLNPESGLAEARNFSNEKNLNIQFVVWQIISEKGEAKDSHIFESSVETFPGWERYYIMTYYSDYLERMDDLEVIKKGADFYASISLDESAGWLAFFSTSYLSGISGFYSENMDAQDETTQTVWTEAIAYIDGLLTKINDSSEY